MLNIVEVLCTSGTVLSESSQQWYSPGGTVSDLLILSSTLHTMDAGFTSHLNMLSSNPFIDVLENENLVIPYPSTF